MSTETPRRPTSGAGILLHRVHEGVEQVLLLKRLKAPDIDYWTYPGGKIEYMETALNAAIREVYEETGLIVSHASFLCHVDHIDKQSDHHCQGPSFISDQFHGHLTNMEPHKHASMEWFNIEDIPELLTVPTQIALDKWVKENVGRRNKFVRRLEAQNPDYFKIVKYPSLDYQPVLVSQVPIKRFIHKFCMHNPLTETGAIFVASTIAQGKLLQTLLSAEIFPNYQGVEFITMSELRSFGGMDKVRSVINSSESHRYVIITKVLYTALGLQLTHPQPIVYVEDYRYKTPGICDNDATRPDKIAPIPLRIYQQLRGCCPEKPCDVYVLPPRFWEMY